MLVAQSALLRCLEAALNAHGQASWPLVTAAARTLHALLVDACPKNRIVLSAITAARADQVG